MCVPRHTMDHPKMRKIINSQAEFVRTVASADDISERQCKSIRRKICYTYDEALHCWLAFGRSAAVEQWLNVMPPHFGGWLIYPTIRAFCVRHQAIDQRMRTHADRACVCVCLLRVPASCCIGWGGYTARIVYTFSFVISWSCTITVLVAAIWQDIAYTYSAICSYTFDEGTWVKQETLATCQRRRKVFYNSDIIITARRACFLSTRPVKHNAQINYLGVN